MSDEQALVVERSGGVLTATLNRPHRKNALSTDLRRQLADLWEGLTSDETVRCVVIIGAGDFFSAGADVSEVAQLGTDDSSRGLAFTPGGNLSCPVIVALNGPCLGGALRFVADADVVIAADSAWLCDPHVSMGVTSGPIAVDLAARGHVSGVAALALGGSRYRMSAVTAQGVGLVSEVVPVSQLAARAAEFAEIITSQPANAVKTTVGLLRDVRTRPLAEVRAAAWEATARDFATMAETAARSVEEN